MGKILVTPRSITSAGGHPALERLRAAGHQLVFCTPGRQPGREELVELLPGCVGYLAGVETIGAAALEAADGLKVISRNGTGVDKIDVQAAARRGIQVRRAEGANARGVAELTLGLIFSLVRAVPKSDAALKAGRWQRTKGIELAGKVLGLFGCGKVGHLVAELALGVGMEVIAHDPVVNEPPAPAPRFRFAGPDVVLEESDVVSLHCPAPPDGRPIIDAAALARMKPGVYMVNTARAGLIDRAAAVAALESGRVAGLAVDVFDTEPPTDSPLVGHDRVIATPHIGGFTRESVDRAMEVAVDNLLECLQRSALARGEPFSSR